MHNTKTELHSMKRDVDSMAVFLTARTKFIDTGLVDDEVANELEQDVSRLQHHCKEMANQVTQLTQGKGKKFKKKIQKKNSKKNFKKKFQKKISKKKFQKKI